MSISQQLSDFFVKILFWFDINLLSLSAKFFQSLKFITKSVLKSGCCTNTSSSTL